MLFSKYFNAVLAMLLVLTLFLADLRVSAVETWKLYSGCQSGRVKLGGGRNICAAAWVPYTAPKGYAINNRRGYVKANWVAKEGRDSTYDVEWSDEVEVLPGAKFPRSMKFRARGVSDLEPGSRGVAMLYLEGTLIKVGC